MSDKGNTIGRLYGQVPMSDVPAADANPPIVAETPEEAAWLASIHNGLDALGAIPEVGAVFDGANALVYAVEGNAVQAAISGGAAALDLVPGVGTAGKAAEFGIKGAAKLAAKEGTEQIVKHEAEHLAGQEAKQDTKQAEKMAGKPLVGKDGAKIKERASIPKPATVSAEGKVGGAEFRDVNQTARPANLADPSKPTLIADRVTAKANAKGKALPNGNMADAHAEIGVIQQAYDAGKTGGADMSMSVAGKDVCGYCKGDIAAAADKAGLNSLTINAVDDVTGMSKTYYWSSGMKSIKELP